MLVSRLRRIPRLPLLGGLATGLALVLSVSVLLSTSDLSTRNCRQIQQVYARIQAVVIQGDNQLGRPGTPGYAYYAAHPDELAPAHRSDARLVQQFAPHRCP